LLFISPAAARTHVARAETELNYLNPFDVFERFECFARSIFLPQHRGLRKLIHKVRRLLYLPRAGWHRVRILPTDLPNSIEATSLGIGAIKARRARARARSYWAFPMTDSILLLLVLEGRVATSFTSPINNGRISRGCRLSPVQ